MTEAVKLQSDEEARFLTFAFTINELIDAYMGYLNGSLVKDTEVAARFSWHENKKVGVVVIAVGADAEGWMAIRDREFGGQTTQ